MATTLVIPNELSLKKYVGRSVVFHVLLFALVLSTSYLERHGEAWGGVGGKLGGTKVNLVSSAGIPMPKEEMVTPSRAVDPTKSLHKEDPKPLPPEPKTDATKIHKFKEEKPLPPSRKSRTLENKTIEEDNAIPGHGGTPDLPTGYSPTPGASAGLSVQGQGGSDFGGRYPWYVDGVRNRIMQNWDQRTIDPVALAARKAHAIMTFRINADGSISNIKLIQSSGNQSFDNSAQRTLLSIGSFNRLPNDFMGSYVDGTFDFDLALKQ